MKQDDQNRFTFEERLDVEPCRAWVNQPSTLQEYHLYHGKNVLTVPPVLEGGKDQRFIRVYFTEGIIISMNMDIAALSKGWKTT
jgi:hypothetical protein